MNFASDNWAGATPAVMAAIERANGGFAPAYGGDDVTARAVERFSAVFEREVEVFFVATGTAANALCMSAAARVSGLVLCTAEAHLNTDEYNATEFFTGMKLVPVASEAGRMVPEALAGVLGRLRKGHAGPPAALSLTNATEYGTVYDPGEVAALSGLARAEGMAVHIDGARFGNAVAATGATPAELTWKAGVDLMSFGGTKNGCLAAEAIVVFEPGRFPDLANLRQRAGHGMSKTRFVAAQFEGYFEDDNWLKTAGHANTMAGRLADGLRLRNDARLPFVGTANELFPIVPAALADRLRAGGARFHVWSELPDGDVMLRLVTSFATTPAEVEQFLGLL